MDINFEEKFQERFEQMTHQQGDVSVLSTMSVHSLAKVFVRQKEKYGLFISYTSNVSEDEDSYKDFDELVDKNLPFLDKELDGILESNVRTSLLVSGWTLILLEDKDKLNKYYSQINKHGYDSFPFFAATIHKSGVGLRENT